MNRPYVIVNCAMSVDGKSALPSRKQLRISSENDIERVYELRNDCDAVLVGIETVLSDDPKLTVNPKYVKNPKQPLRVILDSRCRIPENALVLNKVAKTIILSKNVYKKDIGGDNVEVVGCESDKEGHIDLNCALNLLQERGVKKLLVEGGGKVLWSFFKERLIDDIYIYIGPSIIGGNNTPTIVDGLGIKTERELINLELVSMRKLGDGILTHYKMI